MPTPSHPASPPIQKSSNLWHQRSFQDDAQLPGQQETDHPVELSRSRHLFGLGPRAVRAVRVRTWRDVQDAIYCIVIDIARCPQRLAVHYHVSNRRHVASLTTLVKPLGLAELLFLRHSLSSDLTITSVTHKAMSAPRLLVRATCASRALSTRCFRTSSRIPNSTSTLKAFSTTTIYRMPETLHQSEVDSKTDPSVAKQYDNESPKEQQIKQFFEMVDGKKVCMLNTYRNGVGV